MSVRIDVDRIPEGHIVVGYVAVVKLLDEEGKEYWATRSQGINDMEGFGMISTATEMFREDLNAMRVRKNDDD